LTANLSARRTATIGGEPPGNWLFTLIYLTWRRFGVVGKSVGNANRDSATTDANGAHGALEKIVIAGARPMSIHGTLEPIDHRLTNDTAFCCFQ
jgi:hypothetical protein